MGTQAKVISHQALPGGWDIVIMEKVNGPLINRCLTPNTLDSLVEAVTFMHENDFVCMVMVAHKLIFSL